MRGNTNAAIWPSRLSVGLVATASGLLLGGGLNLSLLHSYLLGRLFTSGGAGPHADNLIDHLVPYDLAYGGGLSLVFAIVAWIWIAHMIRRRPFAPPVPSPRRVPVVLVVLPAVFVGLMAGARLNLAVVQHQFKHDFRVSHVAAPDIIGQLHAYGEWYRDALILVCGGGLLAWAGQWFARFRTFSRS